MRVRGAGVIDGRHLRHAAAIRHGRACARFAGSRDVQDSLVAVGPRLLARLQRCFLSSTRNGKPSGRRHKKIYPWKQLAPCH